MNAQLWSNLQYKRNRNAKSKPVPEYLARPLNPTDIKNMSADELRWHEINNRQALETALAAGETEQHARKQEPVIDSVPEDSDLTYEKIQDMTADEARAAQLRDPKGWEAAFIREEKRRANKVHTKYWDTKRQWLGRATPEEIKKAYETGGEFSAKFPQLLESPANIQAMLNWMRDNDFSCTELSSFISAYRALSQDGRLEERKVESASEFLAGHIELHNTAVPPLIAARTPKKEATETFFKETAKATAASGSTKVVDYEPEQRGPLYANTNKASFRNMVKNLSADEFLEKMQDPQFSAAVNKLEEK